MEATEIINVVVQYGVFGALFVYLFLRQLKESKERETAMQNTLNKFADVVGNKLDSISSDLEEVKEDVEEIKSKIE